MTPEAFARLDAAHPGVFALFERFAFERMAVGFTHYSADAILHRIRWETDAAHGGSPKINNDAAAFYARKFQARHPSRAGFFRTRRSAADETSARGQAPATPAQMTEALA